MYVSLSINVIPIVVYVSMYSMEILVNCIYCLYVRKDVYGFMFQYLFVSYLCKVSYYYQHYYYYNHKFPNTNKQLSG